MFLVIARHEAILYLYLRKQDHVVPRDDKTTEKVSRFAKKSKLWSNDIIYIYTYSMFTRILTSSLLFLIAIGGFVVSYDTGSVKVSQSYAADQMTPQQIEAAAAAGVKSATTAA